MIFYIKKIDPSGKTVRYFDVFEDISQAVEFIESEGSIPVSVTPVPKWLQIFIKPLLKPDIKKEYIVEILDNFYLIIKSGVPLQTAIDDLIKEHSNPQIKKILRHILIAIQNGYSLSQAIEKYKNIFGSVIVSLIKIGEKTGNLEITLKKGAEFLKKIEDIKKKVKQAMIYPSFAFTAITGAMLVWLLYVLPKIVNVFKEMDVELPAITVFVMNLSDFLQNYGGWILLFFVFFVIGGIVALKEEKFKLFFDKTLLKIPIVNKFVLYFNSAFFSEYIKLTISSGLPLLEGLNTLKNNTSNLVFKNAIEEIIKKIQKGSRISEAIKEVNIYPLFMVRMITMGEESGELEGQLNLISEYYYEKIDYMAQNISKIIEPLLLFILGIFMAVIMLALFGPVYTLISEIK